MSGQSAAMSDEEFEKRLESAPVDSVGGMLLMATIIEAQRRGIERDQMADLWGISLSTFRAIVIAETMEKLAGVLAASRSLDEARALLTLTHAKTAAHVGSLVERHETMCQVLLPTERGKVQ